MTRLDEHELAADHRAEELRERDRSREPSATCRRANPLVRRQAFQAAVIESATRAHAFTDEPTLTGDGPIELPCPACPTGRVYVPADSDRERVDCWWCKAPLVTRATPSGVEVVRVELTRGAP